ncbi:hypothetical protein ARMSODRAFT_960911 [Armillaria solidipes]|uniref:Uncharacterized protein n=1 Tax=Armillaria solidipes TaxID=1076256 RepID=A0A2H3BIY7_9AGAR|nr:hypothetical protein ARMSODRAFT_960911 [Armillaria solidipes]
MSNENKQLAIVGTGISHGIVSCVHFVPRYLNTYSHAPRIHNFIAKSVDRPWASGLANTPHIDILHHPNA